MADGDGRSGSAGYEDEIDLPEEKRSRFMSSLQRDRGALWSLYPRRGLRFGCSELCNASGGHPDVNAAIDAHPLSLWLLMGIRTHACT
jgi:hypothetical protein